MLTSKCKICGKTFQITGSAIRKTCSPECAMELRKRNSAQAMICMKQTYREEQHKCVCFVCGREFIKTLPQQKICSEECRREQKKKFKEPSPRTVKKAVNEKTHHLSLSQACAACRALGLSYGEASARAAAAGKTMDEWLKGAKNAAC